MNLKIKRTYLGENYTIGKLYVNNEYFCDTLEDTVRSEKVYGKTAIDKGTYKVSLTMSPHFARILPLIENVPNFDGVRIHRGNTAEDTEGCILLGENKAKGKVLNSTKYEMELIELMMQEHYIFLTVL